MMQLHHATLEAPESDAEYLPAKLTPCPQDAVVFLHRFAPAGPWVLSAIHEGRRDVPTITFKPGDEPAMMRWIEKHQADQANIYFLVGEPLTPMARKAKKLDMARSHWLWADLDARKGLDWGDADAATAEMTTLRNRLDTCGLPPTVIVSSGGGLQAFWHLAEPFELAGDAQRIAAFESLNKSLAAALGADHCHNADRIMRLPGTINFPNAVKRAAGRRPALASLVLASAGLDYPAEAFRDLVQAPRECAATPTERPAATKLPLRLRRRLKAAPADGDRSRAFFAACCALFEHGLSEAEAVAAFEVEPGGAAAKFIERGDLAAEVARIRTKWKATAADREPEPDAKQDTLSSATQEIELAAGQQARITDAALEVMRDDATLYERGGALVRLTGDQIIETDEHWLADYFSRKVDFFRMKEHDGKFVRVAADPPMWMCKRINAKKGERGLPQLAGIITAPTLRLDGSLLDTPGFDTATGLLLRPGQWPTVPDHPSQTDIEEAWQTLWLPYSEFPFVSGDDRAVAVAAILTAIMRRTLPLAPAFSFDAPTPSSGKTLLAQCIAELCGGEPNLVSECDEEEIRKRLIAVLMDGTPAMLLDNIKGAFKSSALEAFMTAQRYSERVLGLSRMAKLPTNILVLISGNNFLPIGDLWRRILTCRIDPRTEDAHMRTFKRDALQHVRENRQEMVAAGLTILRGFIAAGSPRATPDKLGSYEVFDTLIRQCVIWLGRSGVAPVTDPAASMAKAKALVPELQKLTAFLLSVHAVMGERKWRIAELIAKANSMAIADLDGQALTDALTQIAGNDVGRINARILGAWITKQVDRRCGGLRVERAGVYMGNNRWCVVKD